MLFRSFCKRWALLLFPWCVVWSTRNYKCLKNLDGHDSRVSGIDFLTNKVGLVSCSHDKTWKKWLCDALFYVCFYFFELSAVWPFSNLGLFVYFGERKTAVLFLNTPDIVKVRSQTNEYCVLLGEKALNIVWPKQRFKIWPTASYAMSKEGEEWSIQFYRAVSYSCWIFRII